MKPSSPGSNSVPSGAESSAVATQYDELKLALQRVEEIESQQRRVKDLRRQAETLKNEIDCIYQKAIADYSEQSASLEREEAEVETRLREVYQQLQSECERLRAGWEDARFELERLNSRFAAGELSQEQLTELQREPERTLDRCEVELGTATPVRDGLAKFLDDAVATHQRLPRPSVQRAGESEPKESGLPADQLPVRVPRSQLDRAPGASSFERLASFVERTRMGPGRSLGSEAPTFALPNAVLMVAGKVDTVPAEYRLGTVSYIGRAADCAIQITERSASRRHAAITATPDGFIVLDLQSQNGTFVNGEPIRERLLVDGDRIQIGGVSFIFRSPWGGHQAR
jgi:hypothetical protein